MEIDAPRTAPAQPGERRWLRSLGFRCAGIVLALVAVGVVSEVGLRIFYRKPLRLYDDERNLVYQYDRQLGWFPKPSSRERLQASRPITVVHNSSGFRGPELFDDGRPAIVFLGDSFVWGYDVEAVERFTDKLQVKHPEWSIYNLGVSGYGTDQEYLLLQRHFDRYKPRVVFLMFCTETDHEDNTSNMRYGGYYKPYCVIVTNRLELRGVPVPLCERAWLAEHPKLTSSYLVRLGVRAYCNATGPPVITNANPTGAIMRELHKYVQSKGATLVIGFTLRNPKLEEFLTFFKIPFVDLTNPLRYPQFGAHWTPEGHTLVCQKVDEFLTSGHFMEMNRPGNF